MEYRVFLLNIRVRIFGFQNKPPNLGDNFLPPPPPPPALILTSQLLLFHDSSLHSIGEVLIYWATLFGVNIFLAMSLRYVTAAQTFWFAIHDELPVSHLWRAKTGSP